MDRLIRGTAKNAEIRFFAATTKDMVEEARSRHNTSPVATAALGRLMTAAAMMGWQLKSEKDLLTLQVKGDGPIQGITVTADFQGNVKGYVGNPNVILPANEKHKLDVSGAVGNGYLNVIKDMGLKEPYAGQTLLQTGEIAEDLTYYFANSEQVPSSVGLGVLMNKENTVRQAGGFIIQLMPFASDETIDLLEENLRNVTSVTSLLEELNGPEEMIEYLLKGMSPEITESIETRFHCNCSRERVSKALLSIGKKDLDAILKDGEDIEMKCSFCNSTYVFKTSEIEQFMDNKE